MCRPSSCNHEDFPCCGCGEEPSQEEQHEQFMAEHDDFDADCNDGEDFDESMDGDHESALESVYGPTDMPEDIDTPMGDFYGGE